MLTSLSRSFNDDPFPQQPPRLPPPVAADAGPAARLRWVRAALTGVLEHRLPLRPLLAGERQRFAGWLYPGAAAVVDAVVEGLRPAPAAFPDLPFSGAELEEDLRQAEAFAALRLQLLALVDACSDGYVLAMARAVERSHLAIDQLEAGLKHPRLAPHLDHGQRLRHLGHAAELRAHSRQQMVRRRGQRQAAQLDAEEHRQQELQQRQQDHGAQRREQRRAQSAYTFDEMLGALRGGGDEAAAEAAPVVEGGEPGAPAAPPAAATAPAVDGPAAVAAAASAAAPPAAAAGAAAPARPGPPASHGPGAARRSGARGLDILSAVGLRPGLRRSLLWRPPQPGPRR